MTQTKTKIARVGDYNLFVAEMKTPIELDVLLNLLEEVGHPLAAFISGGETCQVKGMVIPIIPRQLSDLRCEPAICEGVEGIVFQLPDDIVRVIALWEALESGMSYSIKRFWEDYREDAAGFLARMTEDWVLSTKLDGIQAQADTDIRLAMDEVGLAPKTAAMLARALGVGCVEGMTLLHQRYPVASSLGARRVRVVLLPDRLEGLHYVNAEAWSDLQGGDTDGDISYLASL